MRIRVAIWPGDDPSIDPLTEKEFLATYRIIADADLITLDPKQLSDRLAHEIAWPLERAFREKFT